MDFVLRKFISSRQEKGEGYFTHISQIQPTGRYNISRKDTEEFWNIYQDTLYNNPNMVSGLAERPMDFVPVLNDTDIKMEYNQETHNLNQKLYKDTHIRQTVMIYQKHLKQIIRDYQRKYGICMVLEKEKPTLDDKENISHGFHLHFIHTIMHKVDQDVHLIPRIRKEVEDKGLFFDIGIKNSADAIDKSCTSKYWLLYGSRKKENLQSYRVTKIYDDDCNEITLKEALQDYKLLDIHEDEIKLEESKLEYYLPRILSIHPENRNPVSLKTDLKIITKNLLKKAKESKKVHEDLPIPEILKKARELMKLISSSRADNYEDWMDIGWTLFSIGDGTEEALDMWIEFSSKTTKTNYFSEKLCMYEWERMNGDRGKTIGSLYFYAKQDSPEEYKKIQKRESDRLFNESLNGGHYDMAKWLHNKYRDEFVCACIEKNVWFRYKNHKWKLDKKGVSLMNKIPTELVEEYRKKKKKICEEMGDQEDDAESQKRLKVVNKITANLKSMPFVNNIMKCCEMLFYNETFADKLDSDPYLLHFTNGVLDLREMRLRPGRPTDYISMSTGYDFVHHTWDDTEVMDVNDHLSKVFPDPILKQYFIEYCANLLQGGNNIKTYLNMSGEGDNGKSINMDLLKLTLGKYMKILPTSLLVGKRTQSSQATPEMSGIQGIRFAILQEPNNKDVINVGILKELSGNDVIYVRGLYKESQEVRPLFKLAMICLSEDANISMTNGTSISIKNLTNELNENNLLAWDEKKQGLVHSKRTNFYNQGEKKCVKLTFINGRTITCTPDHKFLSSDGRWIEAKDIKINEDNIRFGYEGVNVNDIFDDVDPDFKLLDYDFNNIRDRLKAAAFCRLLGYITESSDNRNLFVRTMMDSEVVFEDIKLLTGKNPTLTKSEHIYQIDIPIELIEKINSIVPQQGKRVLKECCYPEFIFEEKCPLFLIREFIAGMFGRDGYISCVYVSDDIGLSLRYFNNEYMVDNLQKLSLLLQIKFNINSTIRKSSLYYERERYLDIEYSSVYNFMNKIGFRYCYYKMYRSEAIKSIIYKMSNLEEFMNTTGLNKFCDFIDQNNYSISQETDKLPVYNIKLINREEIYEKKIVYDLTVEEPYHSFVANGSVVHNCNRLPRLPCFIKDTQISLSAGITISIDKIKNQHVLAWDEKSNGLIESAQKLSEQGTKKCISLTFADGRNVVCTPDHRFLTEDGKWIEAQNIELNKTPIRMGADLPNCNDMMSNYDYIFKVGELVYDMKNFDDRLKATALCRLMGFIISDGLGNIFLSVDHYIDGNDILKDIKLITEKDGSIFKSSTGWFVKLPIFLTNNINDVLSHKILPDFIYDDLVPLFLIREFIAGILSKNINTKYYNLENRFEQGKEVVKILKTKFDIQSAISRTTTSIKMDINDNDIIKVIDNIGFRYCYYKTYKVSATAMYIRYKNYMTKSNNDFIDIDSFFDKMDLKKYIDESVIYDSLPTHRNFVIEIKDAGEHQVYDLTVSEPYSSFVANGLVVHNCDDPAAWSRIRVLPHEASFPKDSSLVPETFEDQIKVKRFPRDPFFSEKLPRMKTALMWMMFETYKRVKKEGRMPEPEKVREATSIYRRNNDVFLQFIAERIVEDSTNDKALMSVVETYNAFKSWFNDSYPNLHHQIPSKEDMKDELVRKWGELTKGHKWKGYRLRTPEDDEREGKAIIIRDEDLATEEDEDDDEKEEKEEKVDRLMKKKKEAIKSSIKKIVKEESFDVEVSDESDDDTTNKSIPPI